MTITRTALWVLAAGLFASAASLSMTAVILTALGTFSLAAAATVGHLGRSVPEPYDFSKVRLVTAEPEDAIPPGHAGAQHIPFAEIVDERN